MSNTVIALKKSSTPSATPTSLANGELAINFSDGKLFYKHANGTILPFNTQGGNAFGTVNANGTLVVAGSSQAILTLVAGNNISITADAINDKITIDSSSNIAPAFDKANSANIIASFAFDFANTQCTRIDAQITYIADTESIARNAYEKANSAWSLGSTAYSIGNQAYDYAAIVDLNTKAAFNKANSANYYAYLVDANTTAAFSKANAALVNGTVTLAGTLTATGNVNATYFIGDGSKLTGIVTDFSPAFNQANVAFSTSNLAYNTANSAFNAANNVNLGPAFNQANLAYAKANTANITAEASYTFANTVNVKVDAAYAFANTVNIKVDSAYTFANTANIKVDSAYAFANAVNIKTDAAFAFSKS